MAEGSWIWAISLLTIMLLTLLSAAPLDITDDINKEDVKADNDAMHSHDENVIREGKLFGHNQFDIGNINVPGSVAGDDVSIGHQVNIDVHGHTHDHHHHEDDTVIECKEGLRELFKSIDSNKDGLMDAKELLRVCHKNNIQITESLVVRILTLPDKTVGFNMAKFCELLKDCQSTNSADVIYFLLQPYDNGIEEDVPANIAEAGEFPTVLLEPPVPILPIVPIMPVEEKREFSPPKPQPKGPKKLWRDDGKCGTEHKLPSGEPAQCDKTSKDGHCCSKYGSCGTGSPWCDCPECVNYAECVADQKISGSKCMCGDGNCEEGSTCVEGETCTPECEADQKISGSNCMCDDRICEEGSTCVEGKTCTPECEADQKISGSNCMCDDSICEEGSTCVEGKTCTPECEADQKISGSNCMCDDRICEEGNTCVEGKTCVCEADQKISGSNCMCDDRICEEGNTCVEGKTCVCEADKKICGNCMCNDVSCEQGNKCVEGKTCTPESCDVGTICGEDSKEDLTEPIKKIRKEVCMRKHSDVDSIKPNDQNNPDNVKNVEEIVSESKFKKWFPNLNKKYTYENFLKAIGKYPSICKEKTKCKKVLATMFGHFQQETAGLSALNEKYEDLPEEAQKYCKNDGLGEKYPCQVGKKYYGRGAKQLSWNYNYGAFSNAMFGTPMYLLENPDLVASTWLNFASAMWFYITPQPPKPSIQAVVEGEWEPNGDDKKNGLDKGFGTTIMIINGDEECVPTALHKDKGKTRAGHYKKHAKNLGLKIKGETIYCDEMKSFKNDHKSELYWKKDGCTAAWWQTQYQALVEGDQSRCKEGSLKTCNDVPKKCKAK